MVCWLLVGFLLIVSCSVGWVARFFYYIRYSVCFMSFIDLLILLCTHVAFLLSLFCFVSLVNGGFHLLRRVY